MKYLLLCSFTVYFILAIVPLGMTQDYIIHKGSGVKIYFTTNDEMFPESWRGGTINGKATSLKPSQYKRSKELIMSALDKYPTELLKENLEEIYILDSLNFYGQNYGGTNSNYNVYVVNTGKENGYSDEYFEQLFHAEFSSILLRIHSNDLFEAMWKSNNNSDFDYGQGGVDEIINGKAGTNYNDDYFKEGFLYQYAMSGMENDFNSISKNLFCPNAKFWKEAYNYTKLKRKINSTIDFYHKLNVNFTKEYFKSFSKDSE